MTAGHAMHKLRLGSCPDSWGVWFADDPLQTPWERFLDELAESGYEWLELGPYGYLPTDPSRLTDELDRRDLKVAGGTMHGYSGLHRPGEFDAIAAQTRRVAALTSAVGARHLVFVPVPGYRDDTTGAYLAPAQLDANEWRTMIRSIDDLGRIVSEEYGLKLQFHPHADYHVETQQQTERFLEDTNPEFVSLCLDTGHLAYRRADVPALIRRFSDRIGYVHIKQMDPAVVEKAEREDLAFGQAVAMGASCEPPKGLPDVPSVLAALQDVDLFVVVEQDMYPVDFDIPMPSGGGRDEPEPGTAPVPRNIFQTLGLRNTQPGTACLTRLEAGRHVCCRRGWEAEAAAVGAEREVRDLRVGADRTGHPARGRRAVRRGSLHGGDGVPGRQARRTGRPRRGGAGPARCQSRAGGAGGCAGRDRAAAEHGHRAGRGVASARGKARWD